MAGTRTLGDGFETTEGGLHLHDKLVKTAAKTVAIAADATAASFTVLASAKTHIIILKLPDWTNAVTATLSIENSDGNEIYSEDALAKDTTHVMITSRPLVGKNTVKITLTGVPGDAIEPETTIYLVGN